jgi:DNA mismatch repair protein MutL
MTIKLLPKNLQNQIAAGEVVECPASIIKELVENSIDAGSDSVFIEVEEGGIKKIRVIDNGKGIEAQDNLMIFKRYATSKISTIDDLFSLTSFGFRGEALASISSVANLIVKTKTTEEIIGREINDLDEIKPCSMKTGTEIVVQNLFWNIPARKKFLKSEQKEQKEITIMLENFALSHPEISFELKHNSKQIFKFNKKNSIKRYYEVLGNTISDEFLPISYNGLDLSISGFTTHPNFHRSNKSKQYIFVNNRMITNDKNIFTAIMQSYETLMPKGKYPCFILFINIRGDEVDINVHPRKTEVKFNNPAEIFKIVKKSFQNSLENIDNNLSSEQSSNFYINKPTFNTPIKNNSTFLSGSNINNKKVIYKIEKPLSFSSKSNHQQNFFTGSEKTIEENNFKVIGQLHNKFILLEEENGLKVVDQHAAHERVRLESLTKKWNNKKIVRQPLLSPVVFSITISEKNDLLDKKDYFYSLGFEIEDFGGNEIAIISVPTGSERIDLKKLFFDLLADSDFFTTSFSDFHKSLEKRAISYIACRGAKKFGDKLNIEEMNALIRDWKNCKNPEACAHGRPVSVFYNSSTFENECGRY